MWFISFYPLFMGIKIDLSRIFYQWYAICIVQEGCTDRNNVEHFCTGMCDRTDGIGDGIRSGLWRSEVREWIRFSLSFFSEGVV